MCLRLVRELQHLVEASARNVVVDQLHPVDRPLLQARIHLTECHRDRHRAERADGFLPDRRRRRADAQALQVVGGLDRLVGEEVPVALHPVERDRLETELARQVLLPARDGRRLAQLRHIVERLHEIGAIHHGNAGHVIAHTRGVGVLADVGALPNLLDDVLFPAELCGMEDVDLDAALGPLLDPFGPVHEALVIGLLGAEHMIELEGIRLRRLRRRDRRVESHEAKRRRERQHHHLQRSHRSLRPSIAAA